jgi:hypothetical protein
MKKATMVWMDIALVLNRLADADNATIDRRTAASLVVGSATALTMY